MAALTQKDVKPAPWDPRKASAQAQLVDVLQFIGTKGDIPRPLRVAVLISAGQTVGKPANRQPKGPGRIPNEGMAAAGPVPPFERRDLCNESLRCECARWDGGGVDGAEQVASARPREPSRGCAAPRT